MKPCFSRMRSVPWSKVLFGEEPYLVLILALAAGFVFSPLLKGVWPLVLLAAIAAMGLHAWLWCRSMGRDEGHHSPENKDGGHS